jgi:type IV secretory pathway VirJ component
MALWFSLWRFLILSSLVHSSMHFVAFGDVALTRPVGEPSQVVLLFSGEQGVGSQEAQIADVLAAGGALVFEIDTPRYLETAGKGKGRCVNPAADFELLSQNGQERLRLASYHPPILVGVGSGATFAYATLAEAPAGTYTGAVGLGFPPVLQSVKQLCHGDHLRWDKTRTEPGFLLIPDKTLEAPWVVLDGPWEPQLPQAIAQVGDKWKAAEAARAARLGDLADLPLVEVAATGPALDALAVDVTGSGGYEGLDAELGKALAARGVPLVALSSLDYFWKVREPEGTGRDLARILGHYLKAWHKSKAILIGYSQGADVVPFMVNRLPAKLRSRVAVVGLIGPDGSADFDERGAAPSLPVEPEIKGLKSGRLVCVYGVHEKTSLCPQLGQKPALFAVPGGHAFSGDAPLLVDRFLRAGGWRAPAAGAPARPARSAHG